MKDTVYAIIVTLVLMVLSGYCGWRIAHLAQLSGQVADTVRVVVTDTIACYEPVARDSAVVRYVRRVVAVVPDAAGEPPGATGGGRVAAGELTGATGEAVAATDSGVVMIPITQKVYRDEAYRAYVSGYDARLDSIFVYERTVTERVVPAGEPQGARRRLGVGVVGGIGYGLATQKPDVFVGIGLSYRIW